MSEYYITSTLFNKLKDEEIQASIHIYVSSLKNGIMGNTLCEGQEHYSYNELEIFFDMDDNIIYTYYEEYSFNTSKCQRSIRHLSISLDDTIQWIKTNLIY